MSPATLVVDSWPVLEWLKQRPPATLRFRELLLSADKSELRLIMTRINYGEVIYSIRKPEAKLDSVQAVHLFHSTPILLHSIDDQLVDEAIELKSRYSFAFADAFAAALAIRMQVPLVTGDPEFRKLEADGLLQLHWLGA